jgi:uncharacterized protein
MTSVVGEVLERPVWFPAGAEELFGVISDPPVPTDVGVVLVTGGGSSKGPGTHRNRMYVRLARQLAADGVVALRIDFHGFGESTGWTSKAQLDRPFPDDVLGAVSCLERCGIRHVILVGSCFGARSVLAATDQVERVAGVALLVPPVRDSDTIRLKKVVSKQTLAGLRDPTTRRRYQRVALRRLRALPSRVRSSAALRGQRDLRGVSPVFLASVEHLVSRQVPLLIMQGAEDPYFQDFEDARAGALGRVLERAEPPVRLVVADGRLHSFPTVACQDLTISTVHDWVMSLAGSTSP